MAAEWFLNIPGILGSSRNPRYHDQHEVLDWELSQFTVKPLPAMPPEEGPPYFYIVRPEGRDATSALLSDAAETGQRFNAILTFVDWVEGKEAPREIMELRSLAVRSVKDVFWDDGWSELVVFKTGQFPILWRAMPPRNNRSFFARLAASSVDLSPLYWFIGGPQESERRR